MTGKLLNFLNYQLLEKSAIKFIYSVLFTKKCHKFSLFVIMQLLAWLLYFSISAEGTIHSLLGGSNPNTFRIAWAINMILTINVWNSYLFMYYSVFKYEYIKVQEGIITSIAEIIYKNPMFFALMLYRLDSKSLLNSVDSSFWFLITANYYFLTLHMLQFYSNFDREISAISNFNNTNGLIWKIRKVTYLIIFADVLFTVIISIPLIYFDSPYAYIFIGKGMYILVKSLELLITRIAKIEYLRRPTYRREKYYVNKLKSKSFIELATMYLLFDQIFYVFRKSEFSFLIDTIFFILCCMQFYFGLIYYRNYENCKEDFRHTDKFLNKIESSDELCEICHQRKIKCRMLKCKHQFHLVCIWGILNKENPKCPICNEKIVIPRNTNWFYHPQYYEERNEFVYSFKPFEFLPFRCSPTINLIINRVRLN